MRIRDLLSDAWMSITCSWNNWSYLAAMGVNYYDLGSMPHLLGFGFICYLAYWDMGQQICAILIISAFSIGQI